MSISDANQWQKLDVATRQHKVRDFYATNSQVLMDDFLGLVRAPHGYGVYASIGPNYQYAVFGRDSITVAQDLMDTQPALVKEIILMLAGFQGREFNMQSEEEYGKIHHEYRSLHFNGHPVPKAARVALEKLGPQWGGSESELLYYGAYDATPMFIRLVRNFCLLYGDDILTHPVRYRDGTECTLRDSVRAAAEWLASKITASSWGLYEFKRLNPLGLTYQSWEDSSVAFLHADGTTANQDEGIAAVELQGHAYDALEAAAQLVANDENEADAWRHLAAKVRDRMLDMLWMQDANYFCMGLDRTGKGETRQIATITANPGLLLTSELFDRMPHQDSWPYIEGLVRLLFSHELLTQAGLRLRAHKHAHLVTFADYHGSLVTWPHHSMAIAKGLRKHGFYKLSGLLENCVLESVSQAGEFYEFFFVNREGRVKYHYRNENPDEPNFHEFGAANLPEPGQAWTISSIIGTIHSRHNPSPVLPVSEPVRSLEEDIISRKYIIDIAKNVGIKL